MAESKRSESPGSEPGGRPPKPRKRGVSAAIARVRESAAAPPAGGVIARVAAGFVALVAALAAVVVELATGILRAAGAGLGALLRPLAGGLERLAAVVAAAVRMITPARGLLIAALGCAVLLGLSQFADYRGVAVGAADYSGVEAVAPPPEVDRAETGSAHAYIFVPGAILAIALLAAAARSGRWQLCRLVVLIGLAAVVVSLLVDRPEGLDEGTVARDFAGAEARLLGGFWAQLFAGAGLALTAGLLSSELRRSEPGPDRRVRRTAVTADADAAMRPAGAPTDPGRPDPGRPEGASA